MKLGVLVESDDETRVAVVPNSVPKLKKLGFEVIIESGAGHQAHHSDSEYEAKGATIGTREDAMGCNLLICIGAPDFSSLSEDQIVACVSDPFRHPDRIRQAMDAKVTLMSMDMIPRRLSRAQSMDVNSSQDNLAGYKAVLLGAAN